MKLKTFEEWLSCGYSNINRMLESGRYDLKDKYDEYRKRGVNGNKTFYSAYNKDFSLKPTTFASNFKLNLKKDKVLTENMRYKKGRSDKSVRSLVPFELLINIREQLKDLMND